MITITNQTKVLGNIYEDDICTHNTFFNTITYNNKIYYYKAFNFNELIGEYLCRYLDLDCVHNELAFKNNILYLATESFRKKGYIYEYPNFNNFDELLNKCINDDNINKIIESHMKLFATDIYMRQRDRDNRSNLTYKYDKDKYISLSPVYDFGHSFFNTNNYSNIFFDINFNSYELNNLYKKYPSLHTELEKLYKIELYNVICSILSDYKLTMSNKMFLYYESNSEKSLKILKKIL